MNKKEANKLAKPLWLTNIKVQVWPGSNGLAYKPI